MKINETKKNSYDLPCTSSTYQNTRNAILKDLVDAKEPPVENIGDITDYMTIFMDKRQEQLTLGEYEKAHKTAEMMKNFSKRAQSVLFSRKCKSELSNLRNRLSCSKEVENVFRMESDKMLKNMENDADFRLEKLNEKHNGEWSAYIARKPHGVPARFGRSPELLQLLYRERLFLRDNNISAAAATRAEIKQVESRDAENALRVTLERWRTEGRNLKCKHEKEISAMLQRINERKTVESHDISKKKESMDKRKEILSKEITVKKNAFAKSTPHAIRRTLLFEPFHKSRSPMSNSMCRNDLIALAAALPERSHEILNKF